MTTSKDQRQSINSILEIDEISKSFGGIQAVQDVSMTVREREIIGLIGPNGAGKTTVFNLVTGLDEPDRGHIRFNGREITGVPAHRIVREGIARTFQNNRLLQHLTVIDNVKVAFHNQTDYGFYHALLRLPKYCRCERRLTDKSKEFLHLCRLESVAYSTADSLPYGQRRKLEIARAMATGGTLMLLDEPAAGMNPQETDELMDLISRINTEYNLTIFLIEHDMTLVMNICHRLVVMDHGKVIASGVPNEIKRNPAVIEAYLGVRRED